MELEFDTYTAQQCCDNPDCDDSGTVGENTMRTHSRLHPHVYCHTCTRMWVMTTGTFFYNVKAPVSRILEVVKRLSEGMGIRAVSRSKGVTTDARSAWGRKAADHSNALTVCLERAMHLTQCHIDEFWSYRVKKSASERRRSGSRGLR